MRRNGPAYPLRSRRSRVASLTLTDPSGECDLLLRDPYLLDFLGLHDSYLEVDGLEASL